MPDRPDSHKRHRPSKTESLRSAADGVAELIRKAYDKYAMSFLEITRRAKRRFETRDWKGNQQDANERFDLYENVLAEVAVAMTHEFGSLATDRVFWVSIKRSFAKLSMNRHDTELMETFFNSVTRKVLMTVGIDREVEFFRLVPPPTDHSETQVFRRYVLSGSSRSLIEAILRDYGFAVDYEDLSRDAQRVADEVDLYLWPVASYGRFESIDVVASPFYRNKVAYIVGRVNAGGRCVPLVLPLYNERTGIYVDTVLLSERDASIIFSFANSYFHVEVQRHGPLIEFLRSILPEKPIAELYSSLGYNKHGKTEFYRSLHHFVHESKERFVIAPGKEGAVMIGFTLPDFEYVFKVIKDRPCFLRSGDITTKQTSQEEVRRQYDFVSHRDRVGRMVDTQEFENLQFKKKRFSERLLRELKLAARESVTIEHNNVIISHMYVQRKVLPVPMFLEQTSDPEEIRSVILDFGYFLKDLAATGIFPYDLFNTWNYGVTRRFRVVLFDYDDVQPLEKANFRIKPEARDNNDEMLPDEDRISPQSDDFYLDEIERFSGIPLPLKGVFDAVHANLYLQSFWRQMQRRVKRGEIVDIVPYDRSKRFQRK
ncbi:MAG: bifunctional isocitrate dehydrogenase kinase/phosphatase [candidate division Zixibacteria bacterium]|nr:bifunctional isocitrate dehydrogenase kinase/phosphatase [candidate division Zixibacteria bacterium]